MIGGSSISSISVGSSFNDRKEPGIGFSLSEKRTYGAEVVALGTVVVDLGDGSSTKQAFGMIPISFPGLGSSASQKEAFGVEWVVGGVASPDLGTAFTSHETFGWIADYLIDGVPVMTASRSGSTVTIDIDNLGNTPVNIWKTDEHRQNFTFVGNYEVSDFPIEITGVTGNPKFKAAFAVVAIRSGQETTSSGRRSRSKFTIQE